MKEKVIIITGASEGIGAAAVKKLVNQGHKLVLVARRETLLVQFANRLDSDNILTHAMDVRDYESFKILLEKVQEKWGRVDVLVNNAGAHVRGTVESREVQDFDLMVNVNLTAPIALANLVLPYMKKQKEGKIVNIASLAGRVPVKNAATYSSTKFALRAFSYALADELREACPHIKCSIISPGPVKTDFIFSSLEAASDITFSQPISTVDQIADMICESIESDQMEFVSGGLKTRVLTNMGYVFPKLRRVLQPLMTRKGKRVKEKLIAEQKREKGV